MAKAILGIDIGYDHLKLALVSGRKVLRTVSVPMPKNLVRDGNIVSAESMGELLRLVMKENGIRAKAAACVLSDENVYVKNVVMPQMTADQLVYNLPFEFRDYISGEIRDYVFDYAVVSEQAGTGSGPDAAGYAVQEGLGEAPEGIGSGAGAYSYPAYAGEDAEGEEADRTRGTPSMALLAVSAPRAYMEETRSIMRKAGMKLEKAAPAICAYIQLIRARQGNPGGKKAALGYPAERRSAEGNDNNRRAAERNARGSEEEYCILDLGYKAIRVHMFRGDRYVVTRILDIGLSALDEVIADAFGVDIHLAHTYLLTDFEGCQQSPVCEDAYRRIAMELMRVLNFYRYSNPDSRLQSVTLCGGGADIAPLREAIGGAMDLEILPASSLVPGGTDIEDCSSFVQAIGIAMD